MDVFDWSKRVLKDAEDAVSIAKEQITRYHEQARGITNRFFETSPESNKRLRRVLVRVPREDLAELFERHGVTAGSLEKEISELIHMIRKDGSNSIITYAARLGEGVNYDEIVRDVADKVEVKFNPKEVRTEADLEILIIQRIVEEAVAKLTPEERQEIEDNLRKLGEKHQQAWKHFLEAGGAGVLTVLRVFGPRILFQVLKSFLMTFMGWRMAGYLAWRAVGLAIPFLNLVLWGWLVIDVAGPAYRKTVPTVFQIGLMRLEYGEEVER
jgi:uncharacterized protein YaaW (UPF0174 family)